MKANTFLDLFMYQVAEHGAKPAVIDPETGRQMTYAELLERACRVAAFLAENGTEPGKGKRIAICMGRIYGY